MQGTLGFSTLAQTQPTEKTEIQAVAKVEAVQKEAAWILNYSFTHFGYEY